MSILKNLKKNKSKMDIRKGSQVIANINKLREMKLLHVDFGERKFSIQPELWVNKDEKFINNFCRAVAVYWNATTAQDSKHEVFEVYGLSEKFLIGTYSFEHGFQHYHNVERIFTNE